MSSLFNNIPESQIKYESEHFFIIEDKYPVSRGHLLIISKKEKLDYFNLNDAERLELNNLILKAKVIIEERLSPDGYNIGMNCGETAGQTIFHFHCHVIPRYKGDMEDPKGGIRHCIKGKGYY